MQSVYYSNANIDVDEPVAAFYNEESAQKYVEDHGIERYTYIEIDMLDAD